MKRKIKNLKVYICTYCGKRRFRETVLVQTNEWYCCPMCKKLRVQNGIPNNNKGSIVRSK